MTTHNEPEPGDLTDAAAEQPETGPLRRCIVTRERGERARMLRFVVSPDRRLTPDLLAKLPGRGIWLSARRDVVETARARGAFARAAKGAVTLPPDLAGLIETGLVRRVTDLLGLARRAGQAVSGFQKAREWLTAGRAGLVVQAADGSPDERDRFLSGARTMPVVTPLSAQALGAVFGRDHVVHAIVARGRLAEALAIETERLAGFAGQRIDELDGAAGQRTERLDGAAGQTDVAQHGPAVRPG